MVFGSERYLGSIHPGQFDEHEERTFAGIGYDALLTSTAGWGSSVKQESGTPGWERKGQRQPGRSEAIHDRRGPIGPPAFDPAPNVPPFPNITFASEG